MGSYHLCLVDTPFVLLSLGLGGPGLASFLLQGFL